MLRDRGNIKWQGMFLPEHVKALREHQLELKKKSKAVIDLQQIKLMEETIREAMEFNQALNFVYFRDGEHQLLVGKVHYIEHFKQKLRIVDEFDSLHIVLVNELVDGRIN
jgi:YolD-like protein